MPAFARRELTSADLPMVLENANLVSFFFELVEKAKKKEPVLPSDIAMATAIVGAILVYNNLQRVGAVQGTRADEVSAALYEEKGEHQYSTITVKEHKTSSFGATPVVAKDGDITLIHNHQATNNVRQFQLLQSGSQ